MFPPEDWDFISDKCYQQFQVRPIKNMATMIYGGKMLKYVSNIVFSNGLMDPWASGGVLRNQNPQSTIIIVPDAVCHLDLRGSTDFDPPSIIEARTIERQTIRRWLSNF